MNAEITTNWRARLIAYAPLFLWMAVVLSLSFGEASMSETSRIIRPILKFLFPAAPEATITAYHAFIRKSAHFTEYAILAFFAVRAFSAASVNFIKNNRFWLAVALVVLVAATDEFHQSFEATRTGSIHDVLLDATGGITMVFLYWLITRHHSHHSVESGLGEPE